jgi:hypothetical protein
MLEPGENPRLPLPLDQIDRDLRSAFFHTLKADASLDRLLPSRL